MFGDFETMAAIGGAAAVVALLGWIGDRRRMRRNDLDAVGFMPWTAVFFVALLIACVALGFAAKDWLVG